MRDSNSIVRRASARAQMLSNLTAMTSNCSTLETSLPRTCADSYPRHNLTQRKTVRMGSERLLVTVVAALGLVCCLGSLALNHRRGTAATDNGEDHKTFSVRSPSYILLWIGIILISVAIGVEFTW